VCAGGGQRGQLESLYLGSKARIPSMQAQVAAGLRMWKGSPCLYQLGARRGSHRILQDREKLE
jgi:hypothetical protein